MRKNSWLWNGKGVQYGCRKYATQKGGEQSECAKIESKDDRKQLFGRSAVKYYRGQQIDVLSEAARKRRKFHHWRSQCNSAGAELYRKGLLCDIFCLNCRIYATKGYTMGVNWRTQEKRHRPAGTGRCRKRCAIPTKVICPRSRRNVWERLHHRFLV